MSKRAASSNPFDALRKLRKTASSSSAGSASPTASPAPPSGAPSAAQDTTARPAATPSRPKAAFVATQRDAALPAHSAEHAMFVSPTLDLALLVVAPGTPVAFKGAVRIAAVVGTCRVLGAEMRGPTLWSALGAMPVHSRFLHVFSPSSASLLQIEAAYAAGSDLNGGDADDDRVREYTAEIVRLLGTLPAAVRSASGACVVAVRAHNTHIEHIERMMPVFRSILTTDAPRRAVSSSTAGPASIRHLMIVSPESHDAAAGSAPPTVIPDSWRDSASKLVEAAAAGVPRICIVGARNAGKSTFARFLVNTLLTSAPVATSGGSAAAAHPEVAYIDCDPGQPGLSPPGLVSLHCVRAPLLGPAFTTLLPPLRALFVGSSSPREDPDYFAACVGELVAAWRREMPSAPLVVNTNGWIKGMGYDLLMHFIDTLSPTDLVHVAPAVARSATVRADKPPRSAAARIKLNAADQRALSMVSYFMRPPAAEPHAPFSPTRWDLDTPLTHRAPYAVAMQSLRVKFVHEDVPASQALAALNGTVVGLVIDACEYHQQQQQQQQQQSATPATPADGRDAHAGIRIVPACFPLVPANTHCVGLAVVRAVDLDSGMLHVLSPVPRNVLLRVNLLVRSPGVELPVCLLTDGLDSIAAAGRPSAGASFAPPPYTTYMLAEGAGAAAKRNRHLLRRKVSGRN
nr:Polynucleotide 5'-hydroxyl-kinase nol9 [Polyrhizophydium stewartii]